MSDKVNKKELLKQISAVDFVLVDLHLYLNTHPSDCDAISKYNSISVEANRLKQNYEKYFGPLAYGAYSECPWQWMDEPWPWEYEANFRL
ncbi:spore coat protein CotJB [Clostridium fermenticellae]|uniref:Spore coat protein CotJB n=1 Tax=Clostridium fermenticellae TaxID=2068654 RepID=A0A386H6B4_9CLOT|nr:spore coat protein CotJB [Clostridium fermenticellae]AYD41180.1 spore coat protein CotJB [Clostridium fermenticellae]